MPATYWASASTVLFAPEDLALVKGDPSNRRRFLDELLVSLVPHHAATRSDYERVLKQRNALLKSARAGKFTSAHESTLEVWDQHMAEAGAELLKARLELVDRLQPHLNNGLRRSSRMAPTGRRRVPVHDPGQLDDDGEVENDGGAGLPPLAGPERSRSRARRTLPRRPSGSNAKEVERGISLVGPHRDELELVLGTGTGQGYASHGETWSMACPCGWRPTTYARRRPHRRSAPVLILDDVFAELDIQRRRSSPAIVAGAEQVLVTAAVAEDIPEALSGEQFKVVPGGVASGQETV